MFDIVVCDLGSPNSDSNIETIRGGHPYARTVRYWGNFLATIQRAITDVRTTHFWFVSSDCNLCDWDFNWRPDAWEDQQIHCWSNNQNKFGGVFLIPREEFLKQNPQRLELFKDINYHSSPYKSEEYYRFIADNSADDLASGYHHIRHTGSFHNLVMRCCEQSPTELFYLYLSKDQPMDWHYRDLPHPGWDQSTAYHFHRPEQQYGQVFVVNKRKYLSAGIDNFSDLDDIMYVPDLLEPVVYPAVILEHSASDPDHICKVNMQAHPVRFFSDYLSTFKRLTSYSNSRLWVFSDICDYDNFDWKYLPPPWEDKIDVWPSGNQLQGDTFLLSQTFLRSVDQLQELHDYAQIDYDHDSLPRQAWPKINWWGDNLAQVVAATDFNADYLWFAHSDVDTPMIDEPSFWSEPKVIDQGARGAHALIPKQAKQAIQNQIYDYDLILRTAQSRGVSFAQNVFFISYDETNADSNYDELIKQTSAHRIHGIQGMVPALKKCAAAATTPWFWAVFGKTKVVENFNWSWTPDFFKNPCNYVFHGYNPVLDHSYGHGGVVLYNTRWVEEVKEWGFDFTMSYELETVPIVSTFVDYANTPLTAWRTAVREGYKLSYHLNQRPSVEDQFVLDLWLNQQNTQHGPWSRLGAHMGCEMYKQGIGYQQLMDWIWLSQCFDRLLAVSHVPQQCFAYPIDLLVTKIGMHRQA